MGSDSHIPILRSLTLTGSGNVTIPNIPGLVEILYSGHGGGGGGGGGSRKSIGFGQFRFFGGGGGAGAIVATTNVLAVTPGQVLAFSVAGGGAGGISGTTGTDGSSGGTTTLGAVSLIGGRGGQAPRRQDILNGGGWGGQPNGGDGSDVDKHAQPGGNSFSGTGGTVSEVFPTNGGEGGGGGASSGNGGAGGRSGVSPGAGGSGAGGGGGTNGASPVNGAVGGAGSLTIYWFE